MHLLFMATLAKDGHGSRDELLALLEEFDVGMLVTNDEQGCPRARPMALRLREHDHALWFVTSDEAPKVQEIERNPHVGAIFFRDRDRAWVSVSGRASLIRDSQRTHELWTPAMKAYFQGPDDPSILLVRLEPRHAEFFQPNLSKPARVFRLLEAMVGHAPPDMGTVKHVGPAELNRLSDPLRPTHPTGK